MAKRTLYPLPACPCCGETQGSRTVNTVYTLDSEIIRQRMCGKCGFKWHTYQETEMNLDIDKFALHLPKYGDKTKTARITRL